MQLIIVLCVALISQQLHDADFEASHFYLLSNKANRLNNLDINWMKEWSQETET